MGILVPVIAPLGRLYEPLMQLARRVHDALATKRKTVWTDDRGSVFVNEAGAVPLALHAIVGTYDVRTPLPVIENDLRLALRQRASKWILDWDKKVPDTGKARRRTSTMAAARRGRLVNRASLNARKLQYCALESSQPGA